jgi:hypothetical protein
LRCSGKDSEAEEQKTKRHDVSCQAVADSFGCSRGR